MVKQWGVCACMCVCVTVAFRRIDGPCVSAKKKLFHRQIQVILCVCGCFAAAAHHTLQTCVRAKALRRTDLAVRCMFHYKESQCYRWPKTAWTERELYPDTKVSQQKMLRVILLILYLIGSFGFNGDNLVISNMHYYRVVEDIFVILCQLLHCHWVWLLFGVFVSLTNILFCFLFLFLFLISSNDFTLKG